MKANIFALILTTMLLAFNSVSYAEEVECKGKDTMIVGGKNLGNGEKLSEGNVVTYKNTAIYANVKWTGSWRVCDRYKWTVHIGTAYAKNPTITRDELAQEALSFLNRFQTMKGISVNVLIKQNKFKHAGGYCDETKLMTGERLDNGDYFYETFNFSGKMWMGLRWGSDYEMYQCDVQALNAAIQKYVMDNPGAFLEDIESMARTYINDNFHNGQNVGFGLRSN